MTAAGDPLEAAFGQAIVLFVTLGCPLACAHCSSDSGPGRREEFPLDQLPRVIAELAATDGTERLVLTGGEPFLDLGRLRRIIDLAKHHGLEVEIVTGGYWARDAARAGQVLDGLPWFDCLTLSADRHHLPFVALSQLRDAAAAAADRGIGLRGFITLDGEADDFLDRVTAALGPALTGRMALRIIRLHLSGRARQDAALQAAARLLPFDRLPQGACSGPSSPALREDGRVMACCGDCMSAPEAWPALTLGDWHQEDLPTILERAAVNPLVQALRILGPVALGRRALGKAGRPLPPGRFERDNICAACRVVTCEPEVRAAVEAWLADPEVQAALALERALKFAEPPRVGQVSLDDAAASAA